MLTPVLTVNWKKTAKNLVSPKKSSTFASAYKNGALDEWLSQRSAKPSTAVRIRQAPQAESESEMVPIFSFCHFSNYFDVRCIFFEKKERHLNIF